MGARAVVLLTLCLAVPEGGKGQRLRAVEPTIPVSQLRVPAKAIDELHKSIRAYLNNDSAAAMTRVDRALHIYPDFARALAWRGELNFENHELQESCADLEGAIALDPRFAGAYAVLGRSYNSMGRWSDAHRVLDVALDLDPALWQAQYEVARTETGQGRYSSALKHLLQAEQLSPPDCLEVAILKAYILKRLSASTPR
jgi:tetratricopeptide (TPR) repeat protein